MTHSQIPLLFPAIIHIPLRSKIAVLNHARIADCYRVRGNIAVDVCIRCNHHVVPYLDITNHSSIYAYPHVVANSRHAFAPSPILLTYRDALVYIAVIAQRSLVVYRNAICVTNVESVSYLRAPRNFYPPPYSKEMVYHSVNYSQQAAAALTKAEESVKSL